MFMFIVFFVFLLVMGLINLGFKKYVIKALMFNLFLCVVAFILHYIEYDIIGF